MCEAAEPDDVAELVRDHTQFAASLYSSVKASASANIIFSPYSISTSLAMVFLGAKADTADEMQKVLHLTIDKDQLAPTTLALSQQLLPKDQDPLQYQLKSVNALWADQQTFILSDYQHTLESAFKAKIDRINFQKSTQAANTINQWISSQTAGKITNLLLSSDLDSLTRLVLTNAVYFQGSFVSPFDEKQTRIAPFYPTPDTVSSVPMMQQTLSLPYLENDLFQMACLPFASKTGAKMALAIFLPRSTDNLPQIENDLINSFDDWISSLQQSKIALQLPKFTIKKRLDLNQILQRMGMKIPFTVQADFSAINGALDLYLSKVVHEALFAVDEAGVVAAAATAAGMSVKSAPPALAPIPFNTDHPFLFLIVEMTTHEILFMGKFQEPKDVL